MTAQYFVARPAVRSAPHEVQATLRGRRWRLLTDRGVFARRGIDPGTRLLIETMAIGPADRVLDVGCGYGPIGLVAAALAPRGEAVLVDTNGRAAALAAENARRAGLTNVRVVQGDGCAAVAGRAYDVVLTNPPIRAGRAVVRRLIAEARDCLRPGGTFYLVARTAQGARTLGKEIQTTFGNVSEVARQSGYRVYAATRHG